MLPFPPGARNEKAPVRFLSGRTSAMIEVCVKGGRVVNAFFFFLTMLYAKAWRELDVTTTLSSERSRPTIGIQEMPDLTFFGVKMGGKRSFAVGSTGGPLGVASGLPTVHAGLWKAILLWQARHCQLSLSRRTTQHAGQRETGYTIYLPLLAQRLLIPDIQPIRGRSLHVLRGSTC